jgi:hypothetical protein
MIWAHRALPKKILNFRRFSGVELSYLTHVAYS